MKRIVTTNDEQGRSRILIEDAVGPQGVVWEVPSGEPLGVEPKSGTQGLEFPEGLHARYLEIPPDVMLEAALRRGIPGHDEQGFHRTPTLDFVVLLEGALKLKEGEAVLAPGDVVVQRDTNHAWRAGDAPARCFVVISKLPVAP